MWQMYRREATIPHINQQRSGYGRPAAKPNFRNWILAQTRSNGLRWVTALRCSICPSTTGASSDPTSDNPSLPACRDDLSEGSERHSTEKDRTSLLPFL